ncbi:MAG TPA: indolepyruvate ferredoxin oxidoreductase family protein [Geminicoccaceae bacterium]|nr:indolepyruvate ferredoxin oxidoreductase family protein [Geminicoccus sp.]HMU51309.1 indolepyruvate ferredoxin oxidoreductase family protein [Geminicoccaceae bacterium]
MATDLLEISLDDKYTKAAGRVFVTGIQALVRLPLEQRRRDLAAGLNTAGYITGYRGSPLGAYDQQLSRAKALLAEHHVVHQPGVNEDLAATACQGTQAVGQDGHGRYDGVFAIWYAKGPGVDRSGDAIKHGNLFGSARRGGVLLLLGDDHICESSTTAHQSEYAMVDAMVPILNPSGVQEILEYGLHGIAMSRYSGAWVALKCIHDTVESTASIEVDPDSPRIVEPEDFPMPPGGLGYYVPPEKPWPPLALEAEQRVHTVKMEAARAYARANRLDRVVLGRAGARVMVVTTGKSWMDVAAALDELGIDGVRARALDFGVYKVGLVFPLEPVMLEHAVGGSELVVVVEEKRGLIEGQLKELLYAAERRPRVVGKQDEHGAVLFPSHGALDANMVALAIARRLAERSGDAAMRTSADEMEARRKAVSGNPAALVRLPWFCPGCPHNTSTRSPEGSRTVAGIGCHFMATWMGRDTVGFTQMGGEGASWLGEAPFTDTPHVFQNIGDGTFYHSGSLTVRAAKASGADITFKILYNDAVAMTGGQKMETANLTVPQVAGLLATEGATEIAVVTDEPGKYPLSAFPSGVRVHHRDDLDGVQRHMRTVPGVSAIIYDQTCAAEKRRRRKQGRMADPDRRVVINELVCEGCGDCGVQSNCVAVQPVETELGRKRRIDQSSCNKDFSCLEGFCPSFVTVHGARLQRSRSTVEEATLGELPAPVLPDLSGPYGIVVTGIGGTGVITIAALLGMAAHLEGKGFVGLDMVGLAQKGGAVVSHLKLAPTPEDIGSPRVAAGGASLLLGCDLVVAAGRTALPTVRRGFTRVVANTEEVMTGAFTKDPDLTFPALRLRRSLTDAAGGEAVTFVDASRIATGLLGDAIATNLFMVGVAWQQGLIPLSAEAIERAIEVNGVAVEMNRRAFRWGRRWAAGPAAVEAAAGVKAPPAAETLDQLVDRRAAFLADYQDAAYAQRYRDAVARVRAAERRVVAGSERLAEAAARSLFRLMAYKDEYEVARLYTDGSFLKQLGKEMAGWRRLEVHLAPPLLASRDPVTGHLRKRRFGPWILHAFRLLAPLKRLRGTAFDPFGWTAERRTERELIGRFESLLAEITERLTPERHGLAIELAELPQRMRGFGHVKAANIEKARAREAELLAAFRQERPPVKAAA